MQILIHTLADGHTLFLFVKNRQSFRQQWSFCARDGRNSLRRIRREHEVELRNLKSLGTSVVLSKASCKI